MCSSHPVYLENPSTPPTNRTFIYSTYRSGGFLSPPGSLLATDRSKAVVLV